MNGNGSLPVNVEVTFPDYPFGGAIISPPQVTPLIIELGVGGGIIGGGPVVPSGAVTSVFGRTGAVVAQQNDYLLNQIGPPALNWTLSGLRVKADGSFQLWNPDQLKWHTLQVRGLAGAEYITIGAAES